MSDPPGPIPIDNQVTVTQVRALWSYYSRGDGESSWSFIMPTAHGDPRPICYERFVAHLQDPFRVARPGAWHIKQIRVEDRWPQVFPPLVVDVNLGPIDEPEGYGLPAQVTPLISWRTGIIGRSNRGRTYMGPYTIDSVRPDNNIGFPADDAVSDFAEAMMGHFTGTNDYPGPRFAIVSRQHNGVPIYPGTYALVTYYQYFGRWAVVRRRFRYDWAS